LLEVDENRAVLNKMANHGNLKRGGKTQKQLVDFL
jgi:hypothetical protein